jgi:hypothetical protein
MTAPKAVTMTIGHVSMAARQNIADIIRSTSEKYEIPISGLMQQMLEPQLPNIEEFAKTYLKVQKDAAAAAAQKAKQEREKLPHGSVDTYQQIKSLDIAVDQLKKSQHEILLVLGDTSNHIGMLTDKLNDLLEQLGEKPGSNEKKMVFEPLDSPAWGTMGG